MWSRIGARDWLFCTRYWLSGSIKYGEYFHHRILLSGVCYTFGSFSQEEFTFHITTLPLPCPHCLRQNLSVYHIVEGEVCWYQSVSCVMSHRVTTVCTSRSSLNFSHKFSSELENRNTRSAMSFPVIISQHVLCNDCVRQVNLLCVRSF
jgi:hypothetical protein